MAALGVITLFLTAYMLIFYAYMARHAERDVSFFMGVGIISMIMNLCTNAGGLFGIAWLYFVIALAFIGLGFAVSVKDAVGFYTSIGPWFRSTFSDMKLVGFEVLSAIVFPAGIAIYFAKYRSDRALALATGKSALWGIVLWGFLLWMILGLVL